MPSALLLAIGLIAPAASGPGEGMEITTWSDPIAKGFCRLTVDGEIEYFDDLLRVPGS